MNQTEVMRKQIQAFAYVVWAVIWLILGRWIGYNGIACFAVAMECFFVLTSFLADRVPDTLGRMLRSCVSRGQHKNGATIRRSVLLFQVLAGILGGVLLFGLSGVLAEKIFHVPYSMLAIRILAPALTMRVLTGVFLGYFQGRGTQMPTVAVSVLRQLFYLGFGAIFVKLLKEYGEKVQLLLLNAAMPYMYGAAGMAAAVVLTEALLLLFVLVVYLGSSRKTGKQEGLKKTETFFSSVTTLYGSMASLILTDVLVRLPVWLGIIFFQRRAADTEAAAGQYGLYYGGYLAICGIVILISTGILHPLSARAAGAVRKEEMRLARDFVQTALHGGIVWGLFAAVFLTAMSSQTAGALTAPVESVRVEQAAVQPEDGQPESEGAQPEDGQPVESEGAQPEDGQPEESEGAQPEDGQLEESEGAQPEDGQPVEQNAAQTQSIASLLRSGAFVVLFAVLSVIFIRILLYTGKQTFVICLLGGYVILFVLSMTICLNLLDQGILGLVRAGLFAAGALCVAAGAIVLRQVRARLELLYTFAVPAGAGLVMGLVCFFLGKWLTAHLGNLFTMLLCLVTGTILYWGILLGFRSFKKQELDMLPGGRLLRKLAGLFHFGG